MNDSPAIQVQIGLDPAHRVRAAELYREAFSRKLRPLIGADAGAVSLLSESLDLGLGVAAVQAGQIVGVAGIQYGGRHFVNLRLESFTHRFGWLCGRLRYSVAALYARPQRPGELLMDGIAVDPALRGRGIGTLLLNAVVELARSEGFRTVRLDVVDTNPNARRLYERMGFVANETQVYPFLRPLGFTAATTMIKEITSGE